MEIIQRQIDNIVLISVKGNMSATNIKSFKSFIEQFQKQELTRVVLNLKEVEMIDSSGIGAIVFLLKRLRPAGGDIKIASLNPQIERIFEITKLNRAMEVFSSPDEAVRSFKPSH